VNRSVVGERYRVEARIGSGGMAEVYRGFDPVLNRTVAIKVLLPQFARDAGFVARFRREAQAAARLNHPAIVSVYDTGTDEDTQYIVMEFVEGRTLHDFLASGGRLDVLKAVELTERIAEAVAAAHAQGVIHRDIKPANIMVTREGAVKVMDFGIARIESSETAPQTSAVLGTASYLSPEQAQGLPIDARTDIYSLGAVLYELLCGRPPFTGDSPVAIAYKHVNETPPRPSQLNPEVPPELDAVVMKALAKNPANRYASAKELRDDLERVRRSEPVEATPLLPTEAEATQVIARPQATQVLPPADDEPGRGRSMWVGVLIGILIVALAAGAGWLAVQALTGDDAPTVEIPQLRGLTWEEAAAQLQALQLRPVRVERVRDPEQFPPETVLGTVPDAGQRVEPGTEVEVRVAVPPELVEVPNLFGLTEDQARQVLEADGLVLGPVVREPSEAPVDTVFRQEPLAFDSVEPGTEVRIWVSSGPAEISVPDVRCLSGSAAANRLRQEGFTNVTIAAERRPLPSACPRNESKVADQSPAAGSVVSPDTAITLYLGAPPSPSPTPEA
jgi:serine/threonine-protein kinase